VYTYILEYPIIFALFIPGRAAVTLTSSVEHDAACPGEVVVYTCTALRSSSIGWNFPPDIQGFNYFPTSPIGQTEVFGYSQVVFTGVLNPSTGLADLTTTLTVTATPIQHGRRGTCLGDEPSEMLSLILNVTCEHSMKYNVKNSIIVVEHDCILYLLNCELANLLRFGTCNTA